ncbi:glycosyltransferase family 39 protein, partial [Patescibacteria group bacterium]|nr:glycosyltransferase family 39 protein [Patescibacteria group bacterium]
MKNKTQSIAIILFAIICCVSIGLRLWKIDQPIADWHSFRQVDTASVARIFTTQGIDLLHPRYHDLSNIQSGKDNPQGWRMVEFPLYQGIAAFMYNLFPQFPIEIYLRLITILCSTLTGMFLGIMVMRRTTRATGVMTFFAYAIFPFSIFYGRSVLPDPFMVFLSIASLYILDTKDKEVSWIKTGISGILAASALLIKPQAAFLLLPVFVLFFVRPIKISQIIKFLLWGLLAIVPLILWRIWIL